MITLPCAINRKGHERLCHVFGVTGDPIRPPVFQFASFANSFILCANIITNQGPSILFRQYNCDTDELTGNLVQSSQSSAEFMIDFARHCERQLGYQWDVYYEGELYNGPQAIKMASMPSDLHWAVISPIVGLIDGWMTIGEYHEYVQKMCKWDPDVDVRIIDNCLQFIKIDDDEYGKKSFAEILLLKLADAIPY